MLFLTVRQFITLILPRMKTLSLLVLLSLAAIYTVAAQDSTTEKPLNTGQYLKSYVTNAGNLVVSPLHWQKRDWLKAGGVAAVSTGIYLALDLEINKSARKWEPHANGHFGKVANALGPTELFVSSLVVLGTGLVAKKPGLTNFAEDNLQAQLYTGGICYFSKVFFGREGPGGNRRYWAGPFQFEDGNYQSFFSGHTSVAFATATSIYLHSHKKWWVGLLSYGVATCVGINRVQRQAHYTSDVFFGAALGTAVSSFVYHQNQKRRKIVSVKILP